MLDKQNQSPQCVACNSPMRLAVIEPSMWSQHLRTFACPAMQQQRAALHRKCRDWGLASANESSEDMIEIDCIGPADADPFPRRWPRRSQWDKRVCKMQTML